MPDEAALRDQARHAIRKGTLPRHQPDRVWGGVSVDLRCALCGQLPTRDHFALEMQFTRDGHRHLGPRKEGRLAQLHDAD
jgi:hypothetical protein